MAPLIELWMKKHGELIKENKPLYDDEKEMVLLKEKFAQYMKFLFGGQKYYIGRSLADTHKDLGVSDDEFDKANDNFIASLKSLKPKPKVFRAMIQKIQALRPMIVIAK